MYTTETSARSNSIAAQQQVSPHTNRYLVPWLSFDLDSHLHMTTSKADPLKTLAYVNTACSRAGPERSGTNL